jgi:tetratricopeptide (TPR) repeat protein
MGAILGALKRVEEAVSSYDRSLAIQPDVSRTLMNKGGALDELGRLDEAMLTYDRAVAIDPNYHEATWNLALLHMRRGNFEAGWSGREIRWRIPSLAQNYPTSWGPMWLGERSVAGKTVVVCQDEGLGDTIQFARYVPMLASRGARVILVVDEPLCPLLAPLKGVSLCLAKLPSTVVPPFDFHIAIDSLPLAFGTRLDSIPAEES